MAENIHIMGIVNLTPDSFFEGSRVQGADATARIRKMWEEGAQVADLGACSTRPGSPQPSLEEEWRRLEPVLRDIAPYVTPGSISIDTYRAEIVRRAHGIIGPFLVNDVSAGTLDPEMLSTVGQLGLPYVAMHMRGTPQTMQGCTDYSNITEDVLAYFRDFALQAADAGIREWILDPGFGFAKTLEQNYELLRGMERLLELGRPILAGLSRKSMIYKALGITPLEAMPATQVLQFAALERGATWLRSHDVKEAVQTARLYSRIYTSSPGAAK